MRLVTVDTVIWASHSGILHVAPAGVRPRCAGLHAEVWSKAEHTYVTDDSWPPRMAAAVWWFYEAAGVRELINAVEAEKLCHRCSAGWAAHQTDGAT